jgi:hypothetical protein
VAKTRPNQTRFSASGVWFLRVTFWSRLFFSSDAKDRKKRKRKPVQFAESTSIHKFRYGRTVFAKNNRPRADVDLPFHAQHDC